MKVDEGGLGRGKEKVLSSPLPPRPHFWRLRRSLDIPRMLQN